jgi:hypothetical protein
VSVKRPDRLIQCSDQEGEMSEQLDLSIALKKLHEIGQAEGDLGCAYWYAVAQLLRRAQQIEAQALELHHQGAVVKSNEGDSMC